MGFGIKHGINGSGRRVFFSTNSGGFGKKFGLGNGLYSLEESGVLTIGFLARHYGAFGEGDFDFSVSGLRAVDWSWFGLGLSHATLGSGLACLVSADNRTPGHLRDFSLM